MFYVNYKWYHDKTNVTSLEIYLCREDQKRQNHKTLYLGKFLPL